MSEATRKMARALDEDNIDEIRRLLNVYPEIRQPPTSTDTWLGLAARNNNIGLVSMLVDEFGFDVNEAPDDPSNTPLLEALRFGANDVAAWLLVRGARPNIVLRNGQKCAASLVRPITDGNLELVKLLLKHGADINAAWGEPRMSALSFAIMYNQKEIEKYLRSKGAIEPDEATAGGDDLRAAIVEHMTRRFGKLAKASLQEIVSDDTDVAVHIVPAARGQSNVTLFSSGMSNSPMPVAAGEEDYRLAEVFVQLPKSCPTTPKKLLTSEFGWAVDWLRRVARYPRENETWLGGPLTVIANGQPPEPLGPDVPFTALLFATSDDESDRLALPDGRVVHFYLVMPLYTEEYLYERVHGVESLIKLLQKQKISPVYDPKRPNVAKLKKK